MRARETRNIVDPRPLPATEPGSPLAAAIVREEVP